VSGKSLYIAFIFLTFVFNINGQILLPSMRGGLSAKAAIPTTMFSGGFGYGSGESQNNQSNCPTFVVVDIFYGGVGNSGQQKEVVQNVCVDFPVVDIFYGGSGLGGQQHVVTQMNCPNFQIVDIFYGGAGTGASSQIISQSVCSPMEVQDIFRGGTGYGESSKVKIQCVPQVSSNLIRMYDPSNSASYAGTGTILNDLTSYAVNGSLVNGVAFSSSNSGILHFDGSNDYVSFASGLPVTDNLTYEAWVNPSVLGGDFRVILNHDGWSTGYIHFQFAGSSLQFALNGESDKYATFSFNTNTWYQVAAVYSKSAKTVSFYVNGSFTNSENYSNPPSITNTNFKMGSWNGNSRFFSGDIGLVRIYDRALNSAEILSNFDNSKSRFGI
jgi:hypothetical protein